MSLTLNAEQKHISKIFYDKTKYVIPAYQRPYSWTKNECKELFEDLKIAYYENKKEEYFLGSLILSTVDENEFEVIDGQQRLTTLIMFLKVLYYFDNKNKKLKNAIWIIDDREDKIIEQRVTTNVFMEKDSLSFKDVLDENYKYIDSKDKNDNFRTNIYFFFEAISKFIKDGNNIEDFIDFILYKVSLIPIHTQSDDSLADREKALKIFETMNSRGMPLDDTDIFKSKLYYMSIRTQETEDFISRWKSFEEKCDELDNSKEKKLKLRVFKIYSYINRGENGIKTSEVGLRDFFGKNEYSPFSKKSYVQIMNDIDKIVKVIEYYETQILQENNILAPWFQILDLYTNSYPKDLLIVFLYLNLDKDSFNIQLLLSFVKSLVRYCYSAGSTTNIKYYIYDLTVKAIEDKWEEYFDKGFVCPDYFGMLYKGFGLLGVYLNDEQKTISNVPFIRLRDIVPESSIVDFHYSYIGNSIPCDISNYEIKNRKKSNINDLNQILYQTDEWNKKDTQKRVQLLKTRYERFFRGEL